VGLFGAGEQNRARFYENLAVSLDAGLPIRDALRTVGGSAFGAPSGPYASAKAMEEEIRDGATLEEAIEARGAVFSPFERHVVAAGEKGGRLVESMKRLAKHFERRGVMRDGIGYGLMYPAFLVHFAFLVPPLKLLIVDGDPLAYARAALLPIGMLWIVGLGGLALARALGASGALDHVLLALPVVGGAARSAAMLELVSTLGALQSAGVPILSALEAAAAAVRNRAVAATARRAREIVREGGTLTEGFEPSRDVTGPLFHDAVRIGEASGKLDETFERLELTTTEDLERRLKTIAGVVPVLAYVLAAGYIAWTVISFYMGQAAMMRDLMR